LTGGGPQGEISHTRSAFKANSSQPLQPVGGGVKQSTEDPRTHCFEFAPQLALRAAVLVHYWLQGQKDTTDELRLMPSLRFAPAHATLVGEADVTGAVVGKLPPCASHARHQALRGTLLCQRCRRIPNIFPTP